MILSGPGRWWNFDVRNRIIQEYAEVDTEIVRAIVQNEVHRLLEKSKAFVEGAEYD